MRRARLDEGPRWSPCPRACPRNHSPGSSAPHLPREGRRRHRRGAWGNRRYLSEMSTRILEATFTASPTLSLVAARLLAGDCKASGKRWHRYRSDRRCQRNERCVADFHARQQKIEGGGKERHCGGPFLDLECQADNLACASNNMILRGKCLAWRREQTLNSCPGQRRVSIAPKKRLLE